MIKGRVKNSAWNVSAQVMDEDATEQQAFHDRGPWPAILLVGPTGAGKTPLGQLLEQRGLQGRKCVHFDFGANLREIVAQNHPDAWITTAEIAVLRQALESGALLEDDRFPLAARVLERYKAATVGRASIVLNGLPRHIGQAQAMTSLVRVELVINLVCTADTVLERIRRNIAGDRTGRRDDDAAAIGRKLATFEERTSPLVDYYRRQGVEEVRLVVAVTTRPEALWRTLESGSHRWHTDGATL
jgi:adenylate kinase